MKFLLCVRNSGCTMAVMDTHIDTYTNIYTFTFILLKIQIQENFNKLIQIYI